MSKTKFPRADAIAVARELCGELGPVTERLVVAGSLRRRKPQVGDVEVLFIPKFAQDLFGAKSDNLAELAIERLVEKGVLEKRLNVNGSEAWGERNKLAVHKASRIPVDLFTAMDFNWWNYLVCRTGSAENNTRIASAALAKGWQWNPYGPGFHDQESNVVRVHCEEDVFRYAGLPWLEPWQR